MENCVFCKIVGGEIPCNKIYEDEPQTPIHILVIPKAHIGSAAEISAENSGVVAHIFEVIAEIAKTAGLENGYRVATNCGADGCQSVHHMHFHVLGGKQLSANMG